MKWILLLLCLGFLVYFIYSTYSSTSFLSSRAIDDVAPINVESDDSDIPDEERMRETLTRLRK